MKSDSPVKQDRDEGMTGIEYIVAPTNITEPPSMSLSAHQNQLHIPPPIQPRFHDFSAV